jgi:flagellar biosynthesis/type III secretory pathway chaperone
MSTDFQKLREELAQLKEEKKSLLIKLAQAEKATLEERAELNFHRHALRRRYDY